MKYETRMCDAIALRVKPCQRAFLEELAEEHGCGLCEASRIVIDEAMRARGLPA